MDDQRLARLTEPQKECLRLVLRHKTSKEIAIILGLKPDAVDGRMRTAVRSLGVRDRFEAALLLAEHEGAVYQPLIYQSPHLSDRSLEIEDQGRQHDTRSGDAVREEQAPFVVSSTSASSGFRLPIRTAGERHNNLSPLQTLGWAFLLPLLLAAAIGVLALGLHVLGDFFVKTMGISTEFQQR